jgi:DNA polymerase III delta prime subunit
VAAFSGLTKDKLHHAYLFEGTHATVVPEALAFVEQELSMPTRGNPDVLVLEYGTFGIDEGRFLQNLEGLRAAAGGLKIFILTFQFITREAQNAFLKLFEEPLPGTHFFLITPSAEVLLPTLRSRLEIVRHRVSNSNVQPKINGHSVSIKKGGSGSALAEKFLKVAPGKRIDVLAKIIEEKDKAAAIRFLNELETTLHHRNSNVRHRVFNEEERRTFEAIAQARGYLHDTGPSMKMLLEHVALVVPRS